MPRPRQSLLSRERIVDQALAIVDAHGLDALSIRGLAAELGVAGPSLYNHFATKDAILDAVVDAVVAEVDLTMFDRPGPARHWRAALTAWARSYRRALLAHPNVVPALASGPGRRPAALAMADAVYGGLVDAGWSPSRATRVAAALRYLVTGSALASFARGFVPDPRLYGERYPHLGQAHRLAEHQQAVDDGAFELGLQALLSGLEVQGPPG